MEQKIDPLVERVAQGLFQTQNPYAEWSDGKVSADVLTFVQEAWHKEAHKWIAKNLVPPLPDGSRIVRTDPDQSLSESFDAIDKANLNYAGWLKCGPLVRE